MSAERIQYREDQEARRSKRVEGLSSLVLMLVLPTIDLGLTSTEVGDPASARAPRVPKRQAATPQESFGPAHPERSDLRAPFMPSETSAELGYAEAA